MPNFAQWNPAPNPKGWSHPNFMSLWNADKRRAWEFRWLTNGDPVPAEFLTEEEKKSQQEVSVSVPVEQVEEVEEVKKRGRKPKSDNA